MDQLPPAPAPSHRAELAPPDASPHVAVAPGMRDQDHVVIRAETDTDEDYESRGRLLAAVLAFAADS